MVYLSNIIHPFIDIKGTAWGHGRIIGVCLHSIFCISCVKREPGITQLPVALYIYVAGCYVKCTLCKGCAWNNNYIVGRRKLHYA